MGPSRINNRNQQRDSNNVNNGQDVGRSQDVEWRNGKNGCTEMGQNGPRVTQNLHRVRTFVRCCFSFSKGGRRERGTGEDFAWISLGRP